MNMEKVKEYDENTQQLIIGLGYATLVLIRFFGHSTKDIWESDECQFTKLIYANLSTFKRNKEDIMNILKTYPEYQIFWKYICEDNFTYTLFIEKLDEIKENRAPTYKDWLVNLSKSSLYTYKDQHREINRVYLGN